MGRKPLPEHVQSQKYLKSCGVSFNYNVVDSTVKKGFGLCFFIILALFCMVSIFKEPMVSFAEGLFLYQKILQGLTFAYLVLHLVKYCYYALIRKKLRKDPLPVIAEAYAVVFLDERLIARIYSSLGFGSRCAVVYRELGTKKPRFFLGAAYGRELPPFTKEQLARVFIDRKNEKLYSVDEDSALQPQSVRASRMVAMHMGGISSVQSKEGGSTGAEANGEPSLKVDSGRIK